MSWNPIYRIGKGHLSDSGELEVELCLKAQWPLKMKKLLRTKLP